MSGTTGYTAPTNDNPFTPPADITAVYAHFDPLIDPSVATSADLPASGNWVGRSFLVADINTVEVWTGTEWYAPAPLVIVDGGKTGTQPASARTIIQTGRVSATTGSLGVLPTHNFVTEFPGGVTSIQILLSSGASSGLVLNGDALTKTGFTAILNSGTPGIALTYYYTAYGW